MIDVASHRTRDSTARSVPRAVSSCSVDITLHCSRLVAVRSSRLSMGGLRIEVDRRVMTAYAPDTALFPALGSDPPDRVALAFPDRSLSYRELRGAAAAASAELHGLSRV